MALRTGIDFHQTDAALEPEQTKTSRLAAPRISKLLYLVHPFFTKPSRKQAAKWKELIDYVIENKDAILVVETPPWREAGRLFKSKQDKEMLEYFKKAAKLAPGRVVESMTLPSTFFSFNFARSVDVFSFGKRSTGCVPAETAFLKDCLETCSHVPKVRVHVYPRFPYSDDKPHWKQFWHGKVVFPPKDIRSKKFASDLRTYKGVLEKNELKFTKVRSIEKMLAAQRKVKGAQAAGQSTLRVRLRQVFRR